MRLAPFIRANTKQIIREWESFAGTLLPAAEGMSPLAIRNHIENILDFILIDMESDQNSLEQIIKSHGRKQEPFRPSAANIHAALRLAGGFNIDQMVSEFRALRASIIKLWEAQLAEASRADVSDLTRFHEAIDQVLTEAINHYSKTVGESKEVFLDILKNDLQAPLNIIVYSAQTSMNSGRLTADQLLLNLQILESAARAHEMVIHLLDLTRVRFGSGLPAVMKPMDMGVIATAMTEEMRLTHPGHQFNLALSGNLEGTWDEARLAQVFTNLIGNAARYSFTGSPIDITVGSTPEEVVLSVHNDGIPIPPTIVGKVFDSLTRREAEASEVHRKPTNIGLGLYITKEVVTAHGGTIDVISSGEGTTFTVRLPRLAQCDLSPLSDLSPASKMRERPNGDGLVS